MSRVTFTYHGQKKRVKNVPSLRALREAAVRIVGSGGMVRSRGKNRWAVASESSPGSWHAVTGKGTGCERRYRAERSAIPACHGPSSKR